MHEYDAPPRKDARNARHAANDLRKETQAWIQTHAEAKYADDPRIRKMVNDQRGTVETDYERLRVTVFELPGEAQVPVQELLAHVEKWLDKCPAFPPELLVEPASGRLSRSVIMTGGRNEDERDETSSNPGMRSYVRGNAIHKFLPPFPHRDADQLSLDEDNKNDQDVPELVDMTLEDQEETGEEEGEWVKELHKAAAKAYVQGMCPETHLPDTPHPPRAQEISNAWHNAQEETERNLPPGVVPSPIQPLLLPPRAVPKTKKKGPVDCTKKKYPAVGALTETQQAAMKIKIDELADHVRKQCDRLKVTTGAGKELDGEDAEMLSAALEGNDMCRAWINSIMDQFIKKGDMPGKSYAFKATRKANGELKDLYSFPTQPPQPAAEKRREDGRPGAPPARRQSPPKSLGRTPVENGKAGIPSDDERSPGANDVKQDHQPEQLNRGEQDDSGECGKGMQGGSGGPKTAK